MQAFARLENRFPPYPYTVSIDPKNARPFSMIQPTFPVIANDRETPNSGYFRPDLIFANDNDNDNNYS